MTSSSDTKPVWQVLAAKAQKEVQRAQLSLAEVHQRKEQALARDEKLEELLVEYASQLSQLQRKAHSTGEVGNYRQFIDQLQNIKKQAKTEISALESDCAEARQVLLLADRERLKLEKLAERAQQQLDRDAELSDNRAREAQSIMQFNLRQPMNRQ